MEQNGDTVLHIAAAMARKKLTKIILQAKCNIALKNKVICYCVLNILFILSIQAKH